MKRLRFVVVGLLIISALTLFPACGGGGGGGSSSSFVGTWSMFEMDGQPWYGIIITINANGTAQLYIARYNRLTNVTYTVSGNYYYAYYNGELVETGTWAVDGDILGMCNSRSCMRFRRI